MPQQCKTPEANSRVVSLEGLTWAIGQALQSLRVTESATFVDDMGLERKRSKISTTD